MALAERLRDTFDRADNADLGAAWDVMTSEHGLKIVSNTARPEDIASFDSSETNNTYTWPDNQWAEAAVDKDTSTGVGSGIGIGVLVRGATGARTYYAAVVNNAATSNVQLAKMVGGTFTALLNITAPWTNGNLLRLEVIGQTLIVKRNDVTIGVFNDTSIATGRPGVRYSAAGLGVPLVNDWRTGYFYEPPTYAAYPRASMRPSALVGRA